VAEACGDDFILYASDYPHWDGEFPESTRALRTRTDLSERTRARILGENARRFYRLDG
jgi:predicted TIM-barrel fold metal-dependent hydrolase